MIENTIQQLQLNSTKDLVTAVFIMQNPSNDFKSDCIKESCQTKTRLKGEMNQQHALKIAFENLILAEANWVVCWQDLRESLRLPFTLLALLLYIQPTAWRGFPLHFFPICDVKVSASLLRQDPTRKTSTAPKLKGRTAAKLSFTPDESKHPPRSLWG